MHHSEYESFPFYSSLSRAGGRSESLVGQSVLSGFLTEQSTLLIGPKSGGDGGTVLPNGVKVVV